MLSELVRQDRLVVTERDRARGAEDQAAASRTLKALALDNVLIIVEAIDEKLFLAARNLPHVEVLPAAAAQSAEPGRATSKVLATVGAVKLLEERLQ